MFKDLPILTRKRLAIENNLVYKTIVSLQFERFNVIRIFRKRFVSLQNSSGKLIRRFIRQFFYKKKINFVEFMWDWRFFIYFQKHVRSLSLSQTLVGSYREIYPVVFLFLNIVKLWLFPHFLFYFLGIKNYLIRIWIFLKISELITNS